MWIRNKTVDVIPSTDFKPKEKVMLKARGLILVDYELPNGFIDAAEEQRKLEQAMNDIVRGNSRVTYYQADIKERRGEGKPDLKKLKIRTS